MDDHRKLTDADWANIRKMARCVKRRGGLGRLEVEDIEQELATGLWSRLQRQSEPLVNRAAWVQCTLNCVVVDLYRRLGRLCRTSAGGLSLSDFVDASEDSGGGPLLTALDASRLRTHRGMDSKSEQQQREVEIEVEDAIADLPEEWQMLARQLKSMSVSELARLHTVPRSTLFGRLRCIRQWFIDGGLAEYL